MSSTTAANIFDIDGLATQMLVDTDLEPSGSHYPVLTLPTELTRDIFLHAVSSHIRTLEDHSASPIMYTAARLARVCRAWRTIALSHPRLWAYISIVDETLNPLEMIHLWVSRSQVLDLDLRFVPNVYAREEEVESPAQIERFWEIFNVLCQYASQWGNVHISLYHTTHGEVILRLPPSMPQLRRLSIVENSFDDDDWVVGPEVESIPLVAPLLWDLSLSSQFARCSGALRCGITRLELSHCNILDNFSRILALVPQLQYLSCAFFPHFISEDPLHPPPPVSLAALRTLKLDAWGDWDAMGQEEFAEVLRYVTFPKLESLILSNIDGGVVRGIVGLITRSGCTRGVQELDISLHAYELHWPWQIDIDSYLHLLSQLPNLQTLALHHIARKHLQRLFQQILLGNTSTVISLSLTTDDARSFMSLAEVMSERWAATGSVSIKSISLDLRGLDYSHANYTMAQSDLMYVALAPLYALASLGLDLQITGISMETAERRRAQAMSGRMAVDNETSKKILWRRSREE